MNFSACNFMDATSLPKSSVAERAAKSASFMVTGGGTGGHLFPGIAVASGLLERFPDSRLVFVGAGKPVDIKVLSGQPFEVASIRCPAMKGTTLAAKLGAMALLPRAFIDAVRIIRRYDPDLVFGVGGYASGPVVLAARMLGKRTCIHEQNSVPGITNRLLGIAVHKVFLSMPGSDRYFPGGKTVYTGNPVRRNLADFARSGEKIHMEEKHFTLLVLGGSQGAHRINELVPAALSFVKERLPGSFQVIHQTGSNDELTVRNAYAELGIDAEVQSFITDMANVYLRADLVVSRAGATTLAELALYGLPALLIPFPFAADDHQTKNASFFVDAGGTRSFAQHSLDGPKLGMELIDLITKRDMLKDMGKRQLQFARPQAAAHIVDQCAALLDRPEMELKDALNGRGPGHV